MPSSTLPNQPAAPSAPPARRGPHPSWIIIAAGVGAALHIGKLPPALPLLQAQMGITLVEAGFLLSIVQLAGMALGLVVGLGADGWGLRRSMLAGLFLLAGASVLGAFATSYPWLLGLRAVEGVGFLLVVMPAPALIRRLLPAAQISGRMGWWGSYMPLGSALGLVLGPWVLTVGSWPIWWGLLGGVAALAWLAVWRGVPADNRAAASVSASPASTAASGWWPRLALTLRSPGPWLVSVGFAMYSAQWMSLIGFLPTIYSQAGLNARLSGLLTALVAVSNMVGNIGSGRLLQRGWPPARLLVLGYAGMGIFALLAFAQWNGAPLLSLPLRFGALLLFSAVGGMIPSTLFTTSLQLSPSEGTVSTTVGFMQQWSAAGQFLGPPAVAAVATWAGGWHRTGLVTLACCAVGFAVAAGVAARWQRPGKG